MFDLDAIEKDWKENSFRLSDEEIRKIYVAEGVTKKDQYDIEDEFLKSLPQSLLSAEERLLAVMFNDAESKAKMEKHYEIVEEREKLIKSNWPKKPRLSIESQKKVVEGCMDLVFEDIRHFYQRFEGNVPVENLYYICLESLMKSAKYCVHNNTKNCFRAYADRSITIHVIDYIARKEGISYRNALAIYNGTMKSYKEDPWLFDYDDKIASYVDKFTYEKFNSKEIPYKPSSIYNMTKDESFDVDYIGPISSEEFSFDYNEALSNFDNQDIRVMNLAYDKDGQSLLTTNEISEITGIKPTKIKVIKDRVKRSLRKDDRFNKYRD